MRAASAWAWRFVLGAYPIALVGVLYAAMGPFRNVGLSAARVHLCDLRAVELRWFGIVARGERVTLHDWLQAHATLPLDVVCAVPYATFVAACVTFGLYLQARHPRRLPLFTWSFFVTNVAGFVTYHAAPAAPPWYFHTHGCAVDLLARPSEGPNLARVDALLGVPWFASMYARSSSVFGALPSLHAAYPVLVVVHGWRVLGRAGRTAAVLFAAWMACAAVYLDHHWVVDVLLGVAYACLASAAVMGVARAVRRRDR